MGQMEASDAREGSYVMVEGEPCEVRDYSKSKPGKHGSTKVRIKARGIFDGKDRVFAKPADAMIETPDIDKKAGQVVSVTGDRAQVMDLETYETSEIELPEDVDVEAEDEIKYWEVNDRILFKDVTKS